MTFTPRSKKYRQRVEESFSAQQVMRTIQASLKEIEPGRVAIAFPFQEQLTQQHGFLHAGIVSTVLDSACGYAAFSLMEEEAEVLSIEFKVNLLRPAIGEHFRAAAEVVRAGRTITVTHGELFACTADQEKLVAVMTATMMAVRGVDSRGGD